MLYTRFLLTIYILQFNKFTMTATLVVRKLRSGLLVLNREVAKYITCIGNADRRQINLFVCGGLQMWRPVD